MAIDFQIKILSGEGIECENESLHFFRSIFPENRTEKAPLPFIFKDPDSFFSQLKASDWIFIPGGFSFSDHLGAGKLLSLKLKEIDFFKTCERQKINLMGVCNGFQVLVEAGFFGSSTRLLANLDSANKPMHFTNQWVSLEESDSREAIELPVRHGEGRLVGDEKEWASLSVKPFLFYADENFCNGSMSNIAGLQRKTQNINVWGMMPHPEIALHKWNHPNFTGVDFMPRARAEYRKREGDGSRLIKKIFQKEN